MKTKLFTLSAADFLRPEKVSRHMPALLTDVVRRVPGMPQDAVVVACDQSPNGDVKVMVESETFDESGLHGLSVI